MARWRFRMLERPEGDDSDSEEADRGPLHKRRRRFRRKLERDEPLRVDYSSRTGTHFCRACEAENSAGAKRCANCSAALTGPDQASFDAAMRAERAVASEPDPVPEVVEATPEIAPEAMVPAPAESSALRSALAALVLLGCVFGIVVAGLHVLMTGLTGMPVAGVPLALLLSAVGITYAFYRVLSPLL